MDNDEQPREQERSEWTVPVLDAVRGLPLNLIVAVSDGRVVVVPPAAVGYVVPPESIEQHCAALRTANNVAAHQRLITGMGKPR